MNYLRPATFGYNKDVYFSVKIFFISHGVVREWQPQVWPFPAPLGQVVERAEKSMTQMLAAKGTYRSSVSITLKDRKMSTATQVHLVVPSRVYKFSISPTRLASIQGYKREGIWSR